MNIEIVRLISNDFIGTWNVYYGNDIELILVNIAILIYLILTSS